MTAIKKTNHLKVKSAKRIQITFGYNYLGK
jgi:hypothetical protein